MDERAYNFIISDVELGISEIVFNASGNVYMAASARAYTEPGEKVKAVTVVITAISVLLLVRLQKPAELHFPMLRFLKRLCCTALICIPLLPASGQNKALIDSLNHLLPRQTDSLQVWTLTSIAWEYRPYDQKKSLRINRQALNLARDMDNPEQTGFCWMAIGNVYNYHQRSPEALAAYENALSFFTKLESDQGRKRQAQVYYNLGVLWHEGFGNNQKALEVLLKALKIDDKIGHFPGASKCCTKIASIFQSQDNKTATISYYKKALNYVRQGQYPENQANVLNGLSTVYLAWYRQKNNPAFLDSAVAGLQQGITITERNPDEIQPQYLPTLLANLGVCYYWKRNYEKAAEILKKSTALSIPISYTAVLPNNYSLLGLIESYWGNLSEANGYLQRAAQVTSTQIDLGEKVLALQNIYEAYKHQQNWPEASHWQEQLQITKDSLNNLEKNRTVTQLLLQYETEKKNENIKMLEEKVKTNRNIFILFGAVSLLALAVGVTMYQGQKLRHTLLQEKEARLREQQTYLQQQQVHLQENLDHKRRELMVKTMAAEQKNELLLTLKGLLQEATQQLPAGARLFQPTFKLINNNLSTENDFEQFSEYFTQVHPDFFQNLSRQSKAPLSATDLRYCAYLRMRLSTKEIAALLNIEPPSIRVAKYRLKQKIGLPAEADLEEFIQQF